jgi:hypothetical protein
MSNINEFYFSCHMHDPDIRAIGKANRLTAVSFGAYILAAEKKSIQKWCIRVRVFVPRSAQYLRSILRNEFANFGFP